MKKFTTVPYTDIDITGGFWAKMQKLNREVTVNAVYDRFDETGRIRAMGCTWKEGSDEPRPHFFWDSDVAKWMESAAMICLKTPTPGLMEKVNSILDAIERSQQPDGYYNIFHTVVEPGTRFQIRDHHELYCLGHLVEAAVAYKQTTGSDRFINILDKYIDLVIKEFVTDKTSAFSTPGHEEIELALVKLYRQTGNKKYLDLACFFIDERGKRDEHDMDWCNRSYNQSHVPVREQKEAVGHSVRACYLYTGMADVAAATDDEELLAACRTIFDDIYNKKMYITGGVGSSHCGEAFTVADDLPNDRAYNETCAAIALRLFANRMKDSVLDSRYADVAELTMYNGIISGLSLDGKSFFYENPLEINLIDRVKDNSVDECERLPITERKEYFGCSCCPPNMTRFIASVAEGTVSHGEDSILIHQFMPLTAKVNGAELTMDTDYPENGKVHIVIKNAAGKKLYVRIPWWSKAEKSETGYNVYDITDDTYTLDIDFGIVPAFFASSSRVRADAGKVALLRGPIVYCMESTDNSFPLFDFAADITAEVREGYDAELDCTVLTVCGTVTATDELAAQYKPACEVKRIPAKARFIPYRTFANRGEADMYVWIKR